ncbi:Hypothetical_protein [Hexamita inflata]|uniref:Hypothetical_protein n=1 Tax=Hexamita inflata TaxID=28002 RepID=A0AA86P762_9EUKA|nr:Hypothetical protein HINF_LOCUS19661 [Hexamita inflata]
MVRFLGERPQTCLNHRQFHHKITLVKYYQVIILFQLQNKCVQQLINKIDTKQSQTCLDQQTNVCHLLQDYITVRSTIHQRFLFLTLTSLEDFTHFPTLGSRKAQGYILTCLDHFSGKQWTFILSIKPLQRSMAQNSTISQSNWPECVDNTLKISLTTLITLSYSQLLSEAQYASFHSRPWILQLLQKTMQICTQIWNLFLFKQYQTTCALHLCSMLQKRLIKHKWIK